MSMSAILHNPTSAKAEQAVTCSWLLIEDSAGNHVSLFMPFDQALRMALAFNAPPAKPEHDEYDAADYDNGGITP